MNKNGIIKKSTEKVFDNFEPILPTTKKATLPKSVAEIPSSGAKIKSQEKKETRSFGINIKVKPSEKKALDEKRGYQTASDFIRELLLQDLGLI